MAERWSAVNFLARIRPPYWPFYLKKETVDGEPWVYFCLADSIDLRGAKR